MEFAFIPYFQELFQGPMRDLFQQEQPFVMKRFSILVALWFLVCPLQASGWAETLRVGVYDNLPMVSFDGRGGGEGIFPELLEHVAAQEGWTLEYVPGTWAECLDRLERGQIDVLLSIAYTEPRSQLYDFSEETVLSNWGEIFARPDARIRSILDLDGKTVAVMSKSVFVDGPGGLRRLAAQFEIDVRFLEERDYAAVIRAAESGQADAALANRFFMRRHKKNFELNKTTILVSPIEIRLAFPKGRNAALRQTIDSHLAQLKQDRASFYYQCLDRWIGQEVITAWPAWLVPSSVAAGALVLSLLAVTLITRYQVRRQTCELVARNRQLRHEIAARGRIEDDLRDNEERLRYLAHHDTLTGLPNRVVFHDRLRHAMAGARRTKDRVAILFLDLDRFKNINDSLGHDAGDRLLGTVGRRLKESLREVDTVARLGGDEFVVVADQIRDVKNVAHLAQNILHALQQAIRIDGHDLYITASIGISLFPGDGDDVEGVMRAADVAMYRAKDLGRNTFQFYTPDMNCRSRELLHLESDLRQALAQEQLVLHYQPQFEMVTGSPVGMEALVRWQHPRKGMVSPADFIPLAEETGLIVPIGEWVLRAACAQSMDWQRQGLPPMVVAVNISPRQFRQSDLLSMVSRVLEETGLDPSLLELEITESMIMNDVESAILTLRELNRMGVHLAIDDFGTGYSSLGYLKRLPVSRLKIDQSFVRDLPDDPNDAAIATSVIVLAQSMGLDVIAEGVETQDQVQFLLERGCLKGQGYLFSRPLPAGEFAQLIDSVPALGHG